ncbi:unnamed protein product [Parajaminaea phylloscopi]
MKLTVSQVALAIVLSTQLSQAAPAIALPEGSKILAAEPSLFARDNELDERFNWGKASSALGHEALGNELNHIANGNFRRDENPFRISDRSTEGHETDVSDLKRNFLGEFVGNMLKESIKTTTTEQTKNLLNPKPPRGLDSVPSVAESIALARGLSAVNDDEMLTRGFLKSFFSKMPGGKDVVNEVGKGVASGATYEANHALNDVLSKPAGRSADTTDSLQSRTLEDYASRRASAEAGDDIYNREITERNFWSSVANFLASAHRRGLSHETGDVLTANEIVGRNVWTKIEDVLAGNKRSEANAADNGFLRDRDAADSGFESRDWKIKLPTFVLTVPFPGGKHSRDNVEARDILIPAARIFSAMMRRSGDAMEERYTAPGLLGKYTNLVLPRDDVAMLRRHLTGLQGLAQLSPQPIELRNEHDSAWETRNFLDTLIKGANLAGKVVHAALPRDQAPLNDQGG